MALLLTLHVVATVTLLVLLWLLVGVQWLWRREQPARALPLVRVTTVDEAAAQAA